MSIEDQPVSHVEWTDPAKLSANDWNPNKQAPPERRLLIISLVESGWTQPIVVREEDGRLEIIDGYHRWRLANEEPDVAALGGGLIPVVRVKPGDPVAARMATIRHNRARGVHHVVKMADLVAELQDLGVPDAEIQRRLQMDGEEVSRLADRGQMTTRAGQDGFGKGWAV